VKCVRHGHEHAPCVAETATSVVNVAVSICRFAPGCAQHQPAHPGCNHTNARRSSTRPHACSDIASGMPETPEGAQSSSSCGRAALRTWRLQGATRAVWPRMGSCRARTALLARTRARRRRGGEVARPSRGRAVESGKSVLDARALQEKRAHRDALDHIYVRLISVSL
jgi:hypothetical protein